MFFKHSEHSKRRSGGGIMGLFRLLWSLFMLSILGFGVLLAYRSFSGTDPLTLDPKTLAQSLLNSDSAYKLVTGLLSFNPTQTADSAKGLIEETTSTKPTAPIKYKFAVVTDSHNDNIDLAKALRMAKAEDAKFVIGLGDFTDVGTIDELRNSKAQFDSANLPYYVTAGDHDLWDARDKKGKGEALSNFQEVFGTPYQAFSYENTRLILVQNADNYFGVDEMQLTWLQDELGKLEAGQTKFVFLSTPLYHPSSDHIMGRVEPKLKTQAEHLINILSKASIDEVFSGDVHFYGRYTEPKFNLKMTTIGAVTNVRNAQAPRFGMVDVYEDGSYNIRDVEIK